MWDEGKTSGELCEFARAGDVERVKMLLDCGCDAGYCPQITCRLLQDNDEESKPGADDAGSGSESTSAAEDAVLPEDEGRGGRRLACGCAAFDEDGICVYAKADPIMVEANVPCYWKIIRSPLMVLGGMDAMEAAEGESIISDGCIYSRLPTIVGVGVIIHLRCAGAVPPPLEPMRYGEVIRARELDHASHVLVANLRRVRYSHSKVEPWYV